MNWVEIGSCFMVLFAVIDIVGSIPIILDTQKKTGKIQPLLITLVSLVLMLLFLFAGESILGIFGVDVYSFAVAGAFILFFIAMEMILGIQIFKQKEASSKVAAVMPLAFPTIAGAGTISTLIALRAEYQSINIVIAILLNMPIIFLVLKLTNRIERILGPNGLAILEKMFGIILLAIALKLFSKNIAFLFPH
ncbi:MAG: MarC family protein [Flavobacteriales bacterium]|jgi:multiple antibiotic resistance protein|nr:MarC family protein [Flavobacteriales bacterium]MDP4716862.1 MarC family protein [Flavobacteriales bacterium]MDP4731097.1 MarC family protein [Flavobacteriales bacterium]MDP4818886.1 MarC family protein [Flavobacteriales bacterium]MDP4951053.1 MarC family protein [Flavobacteriales bacterium]